MILVLRHFLRFFADLWLFAVRTGRWWISIAIVVVVVAALVSTTANVAVPVITYTLF